MPRDIKAPTPREARATIRLRVDRFLLMTRVVGATTMAQRSVLIGVDRKTITRALAGIVGEVFMAKTITALRLHEETLGSCGLHPTLDELFEVVVDKAESVAA